MLDQTIADDQGPGIDTNPGPRNADRRQKGLRELSCAVAVRRIPSLSAVRVFFEFGFPLMQALQKVEGVCRIQHLS